ncbi:MAG: cytochrome c [Vicinamibacterales bacterium]|nr:cytochrome c [Acidobacteriota bacterium]
MKATIRAFLLLVVCAVVLGGLAAATIASRGLSTRVPPSAAEATIARAMRRWATPRAVREARNPVAVTPEVMDEALAHFADHCATCHANDGSGATAMGRSFYPPAPDMRQARTQELTDGELFSIIENGIRLTGMPAWGTGTPEGERGSWALVHFIRKLPTLTADDVARMEALNPRSPQEFREEEEARRFLAGEDVSPGQPMPSHKHQ